jgi:hypothetical protein
MLVRVVRKMAWAAFPLALVTREMPTPSCGEGAGERKGRGGGGRGWIAVCWCAWKPPNRLMPNLCMAKLTVVGISAKIASPVANSRGSNGSARSAQASSGVIPKIETRPKAVPRALRPVGCARFGPLCCVEVGES